MPHVQENLPQYFGHGHKEAIALHSGIQRANHQLIPAARVSNRRTTQQQSHNKIRTTVSRCVTSDSSGMASATWEGGEQQRTALQCRHHHTKQGTEHGPRFPKHGRV